MSSDDPFIISFSKANMAQANQYARDLKSTLVEIEGLQVSQRRDRPDTQDFGATLAVILGTASATALANGVAKWLVRHSGASITISKEGEIVARDLNSPDAARIAEAFARRS